MEGIEKCPHNNQEWVQAAMCVSLLASKVG